jgi:glycolate oxidase iron-sulfur subunit
MPRSPDLLPAARVVLIGVAQRLRLVHPNLGFPKRIPLRQPPLKASGTDVYLFTGCVMDAWQRDVHAATMRVLEAAGFGVLPTLGAAPCCGALHAHSGLTDQARASAEAMIAALRPDIPIVVNAAGCGAAMKDYGHLLGTDEARAFSARVFDAQEWLAMHLHRLPTVVPLDLRVTVQDPCHLRHVQQVHEETRTALAPFVRELVELDDEGLCCGSGGSYSLLQPKMARKVRDRKVEAIDRTSPDVVASANPGCSLNLAAAGVPTRHPMVIIDEACRAAAAEGCDTGAMLAAETEQRRHTRRCDRFSGCLPPRHWWLGMHRSRMVQAQGRVGSQVHPDLGAVTLHTCPPGSPPSVSVGVALAADPTGVQTLEEHG